MNNSGSPPHTCGFLICETYMSKSPSTNLCHSKVIQYNSFRKKIKLEAKGSSFPGITWVTWYGHPVEICHFFHENLSYHPSRYSQLEKSVQTQLHIIRSSEKIPLQLAFMIHSINHFTIPFLISNYKTMGDTILLIIYMIGIIHDWKRKHDD